MKTCKDCPFVRAHPLAGSPDWLKDVLTLHSKDEFFRHTCHKTDPKADGFTGAKKVAECKGHLQIIFNSIDGTPGKGGVYNSIREMGLKYMEHWETELKKRKGKNG